MYVIKLPLKIFPFKMNNPPKNSEQEVCDFIVFVLQASQGIILLCISRSYQELSGVALAGVIWSW